ncbi:MAG: hypothetical protein KY475_00545 [Planctomycetes bacterium]|nr:hypothetical protein [Planctomycetota bacterium]
MTSIQVDDYTAKALSVIATARQMTVEEYLRSLAASEVALLNNEPVTDFDRELEPLLFDGPNLPADFSRADIYADHD